MNHFKKMYFDVSAFESRQQVLRNTYILLALSLLPTAIGALFGVDLNGLFATSPIFSSIILLVGMYGLMFMIERNKYNFSGVIWMLVFSLLMGVLLGSMLQIVLRIPNGSQLVMIAALLTAIIFFVMGGIAMTVKHEMTFLNNFLAVGGIVLFIAIIANIFLRIPAFQLMICGGFVIFSSLMIMWQINRLVQGGETSYISATLTLYISLYNLFTSLLQILMVFNGSDRR